MKQFGSSVAGTDIKVNVVERPTDLFEFVAFIRDNSKILGIDTETTGLDVFSPGFRVRTVQFGNGRESFVVPVELGLELDFEAMEALAAVDHWVIHNASFDLQVLRRWYGDKDDGFMDFDTMWAKTTDTRILSHLVDPRGQKDGGIGHGLEALTRKYIDEEVADGVKGLMKALAKELKTKQSLIWEKVDWDHPDYLLYAGMDPILAFRLLEVLEPLVPEVSKGLIRYEHDVAKVCSVMERNGFMLDREYSMDLAASLSEEEQWYTEKAREYGVESVNSTEQVADALEALGVKINGRTPTGKRRVDKELLEKLMADPEHPAHGLVEAVSKAKHARKERSTWVEGFLKGADSEGRLHPSINPLAARTARMSISGIPAQTLPSSDWKIRRCFIPDQGQSLVSIDYKAQELRVLAALSKDRTMTRAFAEEADLHQLTADASGVDRKVGKMTNFLTVYGGGAGTLSKQAGIDFMMAKKVIEGFERTYPGVKVLAGNIDKQVSVHGSVTTPTGRVLPVDPDRGYSGLNYMVQSTSRDVTCAGLLRVYEAGYGPYLRLPVHDEVILSVPEEHARYAADDVARLMRMDLLGVDIGTDADVYGASWGGGYVSEESRAQYEATFLPKDLTPDGRAA